MNISKITESTFNWIKKHKIATLTIVLVILAFVKAPSYEETRRVDSAQPYRQTHYNEGGLVMKRSMPMAKSMSMAASNDSYQTTNSGKKIIKSSSLELEVSNTEKMANTVRNMVGTYKGYVENFYSYSDGQGAMTYNFSIKIPADKFYTAIDSFKKLGRVLSENYRSSDVTEQYSDIENELKNLIARRDRLRKLMETKTDNLKDIIEVDRELSRVQNQVENLVRRKRNMEKSVNYSSLNITLKQKVQIKDITQDKWSLGGSVKFYINALISFGQWLFDKVVFLSIFAPVWVLITAGYFVTKRVSIYRKNKNNKKADLTNTESEE